MIIRERETEFVMVSQHDHAFVSGEIAKHFRKDFFLSDYLLEEALIATYEHDRGWINLDQVPTWNEQTNSPFSFSDYPLIDKITYYKIGLDEVQEMSVYAALLCSMHYCSFFHSPKNKVSFNFLKCEEVRQKHLLAKLKSLNKELLDQHFRLLQVCDDLSLYACLNEPGTDKEKEHPWFKEGFKKSAFFTDGIHPHFCNWYDHERIGVTGFPFVAEFQVNMNYKLVSKENIAEIGLETAYLNCPTYRQTLNFTLAK